MKDIKKQNPNTDKSNPPQAAMIVDKAKKTLDLHHFSRTDMLTQNQKTSGLFSNRIWKGFKKPDALSAASKKHSYPWYLKESSNVKIAIREVIFQEFIRLFLADFQNPSSDDQPKTRLVTHGKAGLYVASKIAQFLPLQDISPEQIKNNFADYTYFNLGKLSLLALLFNEKDFKPGNMGIINGKLIKIDGDCCLGEGLDNYNDITSADIADLPFFFNEKALIFNWLDLVNEGKYNSHPKTIDFTFKKNTFIRAEINQIMLQLLFLTPKMLSDFINSYAMDKESGEIHPEAVRIHKILLYRLEQLYFAACQQESFQHYVVSVAAENDLDHFVNRLMHFKLHKAKKSNSTSGYRQTHYLLDPVAVDILDLQNKFFKKMKTSVMQFTRLSEDEHDIWLEEFMAMDQGDQRHILEMQGRMNPNNLYRIFFTLKAFQCNYDDNPCYHQVHLFILNNPIFSEHLAGYSFCNIKNLDEKKFFITYLFELPANIQAAILHQQLLNAPLNLIKMRLELNKPCYQALTGYHTFSDQLAKKVCTETFYDKLCSPEFKITFFSTLLSLDKELINEVLHIQFIKNHQSLLDLMEYMDEHEKLSTNNDKHVLIRAGINSLISKINQTDQIDTSMQFKK